MLVYKNKYQPKYDFFPEYTIWTVSVRKIFHMGLTVRNRLHRMPPYKLGLYINIKDRLVANVKNPSLVATGFNLGHYVLRTLV